MNSNLYIWLSLFFINALVPSTDAFGQNEVILRGKITNDSLDDAYLHIMNLTMQRGTITDDSGSFQLPVRLNDTLYISSLQFKPEKIYISSEIISRKFVKIELSKAINELETVTIRDINLSGSLDQDIGTVALTPYFDQTNMGFAPTAEERSPELMALQASQADFGLGTIIDILSGRRKMLKRNYEISTKERRIKAAQNLFKTSFYTTVLELPETLIDDFAYFIYEGNEDILEMAESGQLLKLVAHLKQKLPAYRESKESKAD